jgi:hypothetical protein
VSSGELLLVGIATAVGTIALALMLSRIVHVVVAVARTRGDASRVSRAQPPVASRARPSPPPPRPAAVSAEARSDEERGTARTTAPVAARPEPSAAAPAGPVTQADLGDSRAVDEEPEAAPPPAEPAVAAPPPAEPAAPSHPEAPSVRIPAERSTDVKRLRHSTVDRGERPADKPAARETDGDAGIADEGTAYRQVGEDVAEVLTAAERTAARIRASARQEADEIRAKAQESAAATLAEAEARQAEVEQYDDETRAAADAYAEATRRKSDKEAAGRISDAEEQARNIRAQAETKAREIEAEAIRHRDELMAQTEGMEKRIKSMLSTFREAAIDLEELLPEEEIEAADDQPTRMTDLETLSPEDEAARAAEREQTGGQLADALQPRARRS